MPTLSPRRLVVPILILLSAVACTAPQAEESNGETTLGTATVEAMATRIETSEVPLIERMWDPVVRVDGAVATLWAPYDFYAGPDFSHCGVDTAILLRGEEGWRITALSWTRRQPPACALHPDGPPAG